VLKGISGIISLTIKLATNCQILLNTSAFSKSSFSNSNDVFVFKPSDVSGLNVTPVPLPSGAGRGSLVLGLSTCDTDDV